MTLVHKEAVYIDLRRAQSMKLDLDVRSCRSERHTHHLRNYSRKHHIFDLILSRFAGKESLVL